MVRKEFKQSAEKRALAREYAAVWREKNRVEVVAYARAWRSANRERDVEMNRMERNRLREEVILHYSGGAKACCRCGFDDMRVLQLDHINDDGAAQRRKIGTRTSAGGTTYRWLRKNGFPLGYQVLCPNCNWIKEIERRRPLVVETINYRTGAIECYSASAAKQ